MTSLRSLVDAALSEGTGSLAQLLEGKLAAGVEPAPWVEFLADYLRKAVVAAEALAAAAEGHPLAGKVQPFLAHIAAYAAEPEDAVPDRHGAVGLLDDACVVMLCIETLRRLMNQPEDANLTVANTIVRALLGEAIDARLRETVQGIEQRVAIETLTDLPGLFRLFAGAAQGQSLTIEIPTPTFAIPQVAAVSGNADATAAGTPVGSGEAAAFLVGLWEHSSYYSSGGFGGGIYRTRAFGADGRFAQRQRASASQTHTYSDGSWAGQTNGLTGADADIGPEDRGRWSYDGALLRLDYDNGEWRVLRVTRGDGSHMTEPVNGTGSRVVWQRLR
jgi:uncharacterized membrane protein YkvA (DUF1232 family)